MRLIDADVLMEEIKSLRVSVTGLGVGKSILTELYKESVLRTIDEQPTAYDTDKVVAELEKESDFFGGEPMGSLQKMYYCKGIDKAINIVKGGGVE